MALIPWRSRDRGGLVDLQDRVNLMFDEFFRGFPLMPKGEEYLEWMPALDVSETDEAIEVTAELPGVKPEDVDVNLSEELLTIRGEKRAEKEETKRDYHRIERSYGSFTRTVKLPASVNAEKVEATFKDGVLTIVLPKREEARTRKVKVEVK